MTNQADKSPGDKELSMQVKEDIIRLKQQNRSTREKLKRWECSVWNILKRNEQAQQQQKTTKVDDSRFLSMVNKNTFTSFS